ncbi:hypothetical protein SAMN05421788_11581 [Filimonas lacunae]|uniref:Uncharacterized protein n=1 Tax=Filimonas lacunae TaxID=477680 RepID=A0A173MC17_9BACT|nr:hypothetical protein [Filimonas lacunae]BAV05077.1 hypothetical protein FLA_1084 [Filimonas lacunae]SIT34262.1 hypothetical protein SAMN05421788_11581 [Filimonas lacunae]
MQKTTQQQSSSHTIPIDVFLEVVHILLDNNLSWQVEGINDREGSLLIQISQQTGLSKHQKAMENIKGILSDYGYYVKGTPLDATYEM